MTNHVLDGTLAYGNEDGVAIHERNLRFLAGEPRWSRAMLATAMAQKLASTPNNVRTSMILQSSKPDCLYVFLLFPRGATENQKSYRLERQAAMTAYCHVVKHMRPKIRYVICLAMEPGSPTRRRSEDLMSFDFQDWTPEADRDAAKVQKELNILVDFSERQLWEAPVTRRGDLTGNRHERRKAKAEARKKQ